MRTRAIGTLSVAAITLSGAVPGLAAEAWVNADC
jgi:hypothetical protein